ncbi:caspase family protein [Myxococcota bacterium]|nr:caspase family protein [Myxococcota bacterium]
MSLQTEKRMTLRNQSLLRRAAGVLAVAALACASESGPKSNERAATVHPTASADDLLVVDCLLPGQVRKLGGQVTYLTPRRPVKTNAVDCEIRGGEYVAFDRSNYATALAVWLPAAEEGNAEAQNYVGEIFERGLGRPADYATAAVWYRRAAEQEFSAAQINLGQLYERGLGVEPDVTEALRWYDRAAGIEGGSWELVSGPELAVLREKLELSTGEAKQLRTELGKVRRQIGQIYKQRGDREATAERAFDALAAERAALSEERRSLALESERIRASTKALEQRRSDASERAVDAAKLTERAKALTASEAKLEAQARAVEADAAKLARGLHQLQLDRDRAQREYRRTASSTNQIDMARIDLALRERSLQARRVELDVLATELHDATNRIDTQQRAAARQLGELEAVQLARSSLEDYAVGLGKRELAVKARAQQLNAREQQLSLAEASMKHKRAEIAELTDEIEQLRGDAENQRRQLAGLVALQPVSVAPPSIQMIDPLIVATRDAPAKTSLRTVRMAAGVDERLIVGRVDAPAGLLSLTINDLTTPSSPNGLFERTVAIEPGGTSVDIVAVDRLGERVNVQFQLFSERATPIDATPAVSTAPAVPTHIDFGRYYALVIGNDDYESLPDLESAQADANAISKVLSERYGFEVITLRDATRYEILSALNGLTSQLKKNDNLLVYYAGHGELDRVNQVGHWLPVDAERDNPANWLSTRSLTDELNRMKAQHVLVVADSCYSGALTRSGVTQLKTGELNEERQNWLRAQRDLRVRMALTSGGLKPVLDLGGDGHSLFARSFIDVLRANSGVLDGMSLYQAIAARVYEAAREHDFDQMPEYAPIRHGHHENGHFLFVPRV